MSSLNEKEAELLEFISEEIAGGMPPSVREICSRLGYKSTSVVHKMLSSLEEKGFIERVEGTRRNIRLVGQPSNGFMVPVVGLVTAGQPILAVENIESYISVVSRFPKNELFALRVRGDSMIEAAILDGDIIVARQTPVARNGEIVVALIDDEATVKTFYKENGHFRLQPENSDMEPIIVPHVTILGKVVQVMRSYE
ncbi:MAG: transcriptional repressor LexA [Oscillospiraceae bacterium]|nr:transcriptional repressor LexA [Oscillospiraceae bacterium]